LAAETYRDRGSGCGLLSCGLIVVVAEAKASTDGPFNQFLFQARLRPKFVYGLIVGLPGPIVIGCAKLEHKLTARFRQSAALSRGVVVTGRLGILTA